MSGVRHGRTEEIAGASQGNRLTPREMTTRDPFQVLQGTIERELRIRCSQYKEDYIKRRILSRMRVTGKDTFEDYHLFITTHAAEMENLKNALTINVTKFFRDPEVFEKIETVVLPALFARKKRIHVWCAGCSSGEEAYSLAILLHEYAATHPGISGLIYATDIDDTILKKAQEGVYDATALEHVRATRRKHDFIPQEDGRFAIQPWLKELVRFRHHDLMADAPISRFLDFITCRNVTIYFTEPQKNDVARLFHGALASDGYYVMGKTEYMGRDIEGLFVPMDPIQKIYQKKG